jgi:hypothetical protein
LSLQVPNLKIVAADSAAAILDEKFMPLCHVASAAVLVEPPYREANIRLAEPIFKEVDNNYDIIVHEAELCQALLETTKADVVHLDSTLGSISVEELSPVELATLKVGIKARTNLLKILPKLRRIAGEVRRKHNIDVLAIGKESMAVRIAELTAGSEAFIFACNKVVKEKEALLLGLPTRCQHRTAEGKVYLHSLMEAEHDIRGYATDTENVLSKVKITEMQNPTVRGFRTLRITPKT